MKLTAMLNVPAPTPSELVLPPLPAVSSQNDEIENVMGLIRASLNRIPLLKKRACILELLSFLYSREDSYKKKINNYYSYITITMINNFQNIFVSNLLTKIVSLNFISDRIQFNPK